MGGARKLLLADTLSSESPLNFLHEKLQQFLHFLAHILNQVLPPETRAQTLHHWAHLGLTVILPVSLVLLCLYRCCCGPRCFCCCCCCSKPEEEREEFGFDAIDYDIMRMMKAPGRNGALMPRDLFEGNPREYFIDLRAKKQLPNYYNY
ncbi:uncharacterized protein LOC109822701 [Asparagus officinalis]|uniref:uncharacterized protein LOC109822701 n=1 Tax=Asparagus officinalis TaxID=4686 RepID=UPI00098E429C|nr:uncharacterized protein LOC109822701 [Asparagus officinalis]